MKLHAFLDDPAVTLRAYSESDLVADSRYARAIAYYRIPRLDTALATVDGLIRDFPQNPYYRELKASAVREWPRPRRDGAL